jgi:predicted nucleotide-binding protein
MKERFEDRHVLVDSLLSQTIVQGNTALAELLASRGELVECAAGENLIEQGASDQDVYFLLSGKLRIIINSSRLHLREPGRTVGEMSMLSPGTPRSATLNAEEVCVALKLTPHAFAECLDAHPKSWRLLCRDLAQRIEQRNQYVNRSNMRPRVFIICSKEALEVAEEIRLGLSFSDMVVVLWSDDMIFPAGSYPIEALEHQVLAADFGIAVASPDDLVRARDRTEKAPRDNVIFELGFFMSQLGKNRTFLLVPNAMDVKIPSDFKGITPLHYDEAAPDRDLSTALGPTVTRLKKLIAERKVRSSFAQAK